MINDLSFDLQSGRFNYRVGAIIIHDGKLLVARTSSAYYYAVGGRVTLHESAEQAIVREVFEETGITLAVERLAFVDEAFFTREETGERFHELGFYFIMKPNAALQAIADGQPLGDSATDCFAWLPLANLAEFELYPHFFRTRLQGLNYGIEHIVEHG